MGSPRPSLTILGTRGVPARHGGFETFAERLSVYLVARGWDVEVFCHDRPEETGPEQFEGVRLRRLLIVPPGPFGTLVFDWKAMWQAVRGEKRLLLTLGYNSGMFGLLSRLAGRVNLINMDGLEFQRSKWSPPIRAWFWLNERLACWLHDHLIADHPAIADHLATRVHPRHITRIAYGADAVLEADPAGLETFGLEPSRFAVVIARPEPENSVLEIVRAFSRKPRGIKLAVLGNIRPEHTPYQAAILQAAGPEVVFPGAVYAPRLVAALRLHSLFYIHGHSVGGTNPSLVEAMGAGCAVLAHDNRFNRWVAGRGAVYFSGEEGCAAALDKVLGAPPEMLASMREASRARHEEAFLWDDILAEYETLLLYWWRKV